MHLLNINVALELSREIAKMAPITQGVYTLLIDGFVFTYEPNARQAIGIEVSNVENGDPFLCDWVDKNGKSEPCRMHLQRYDFTSKVIDIAIKYNIIKVFRKPEFTIHNIEPIKNIRDDILYGSLLDHK